MKQNQNGFSVVELIVVVIIVGVLGFVGWKVLGNKNKPDDTAKNTTQQSDDKTDSSKDQPAQLIWQQTATGWQSTQTPPACAKQPMFKAPANLSLATSVLYPGQTRGGNYKPHGGFRFDGIANNKVTVISPLDGFLVRGGSYIAEGEIQYTFDVMNNCGVMYRMGHLRELPSNLQKIADTWPSPTANSATQSINPAVAVKKGDILATKVGIIGADNTFFDWGVYDYRQTNEASKSLAYQNAHPDGKELAWHAVCWFDWLPAKDASLVKGLPAADPTSGKSSDYCE